MILCATVAGCKVGRSRRINPYTQSHSNIHSWAKGREGKTFKNVCVCVHDGKVCVFFGQDSSGRSSNHNNSEIINNNEERKCSGFYSSASW